MERELIYFQLVSRVVTHLLSISQLHCLAILSSYFDNSAFYFKTFWQPWVCSGALTLLDISWRRDDINRLLASPFFSKPDATANLQGTFCANTRRIFGILKINHVSHHAFEAARRGNVVIISGIWGFSITLHWWWSEHACHLYWEMFQVCMFADFIWENVLVTVL